MTPPNTITIKSDANKLKLIEVQIKKGVYVYEYENSVTKKGTTLELNEEQLIKLIKINQP